MRFLATCVPQRGAGEHRGKMTQAVLFRQVYTGGNLRNENGTLSIRKTAKV